MEGVVDLDGADFGALSAVDTAIGVDILGALAQVDGEIAGLSFHGKDLGAGQDMDVGVPAVLMKRWGNRRPSTAVPVISPAAAQHTIVRGEHEAELGDNSSKAGATFHQIDGETCLRNVQRRALAGNTSTNHQCSADGSLFRHLVHSLLSRYQWSFTPVHQPKQILRTARFGARG